MITAVIIDLDDTLCLTESVCFELENEVLAIMGREPMERKIHLATWGSPLFEIISTRSPGVDVDEFQRLYPPVIKRYIDSGKLDDISPENYAALDVIINDEKKLFVLTSRTHDEVGHLLQPDHLLHKRVETFYYRDNTMFHKPDPRVFNELLSHNQLVPSECVYVGDSVGDAVAAKTAGIHFIACLESGLKVRNDFSGLSVDGFIARFCDISQELNSLEASFGVEV